MKTIKALGLLGLAVSACFAAQAFATPCATGTQGNVVCISNGSNLANILAGPGNTTDYQPGTSIFVSGQGVNPFTDQYSPSSVWSIGGSGGSENTVEFTSGSVASPNPYTFGIYDPSATLGASGTMLALFDSSAAGDQTTLTTNGKGGFKATYNTQYGYTGPSIPSASVTFGDGTQFGYFLTMNGDTFYSNPLSNGDGLAHMAAYAGANQGKLGFSNGMFSAGEFLQAWDTTWGGGNLDYSDFVVMVESVKPVPEPADLAIFGFGILLVGGFVALRRRRLNA